MDTSPPDPEFTHVDERGRLRMVDVTDKAESRRQARASCRVSSRLSGDALERLVTPEVLIHARLTGIQAAKRTSDVIPLCHPLALTRVDVEVRPTDEGYEVVSDVTCTGRTGVEMEALCACGFAALALVDALGADARPRLDDLVLESKTGGASGDWGREIAPPRADSDSSRF